MKSIHSIYIALFTVIIMPTLSLAHGDIDHNAGYCQNAKTTADLVSCTRLRVGVENKRVEELFAAVQMAYADDIDTKNQLAENQDSWIAYRDTVCAVEGQQYEGGSLALVQEAACLARVTSDRADHYQVMLQARDDSVIPVFSNPPRWVNVLGEDYKNVFWNISGKQRADTDCDSIQETLIMGLRQNENGTYENIMAIADSGKTGRPKTTILQHDDMKQCDIIPTMVVELNKTEPKPSIQGNDATEIASCNNVISLLTPNCGQFTVRFDANAQTYILNNNSTNETK